MTAREDLLDYYKNELTYLRKMGSTFAARYPKVAGRLELGPDECPDPHVERLLEAFALLTARIQHAIDDQFPEITSALLDVLYPHYLTPVPSMAVAQFEVDPARDQWTTGHVIEKHTPLFAQSHEGQLCRFRTCYPVTLWPVAVTYAGFAAPTQFAFLEAAANVATVLRLRLTCQADSLATLDMRRLRFYLNGDPLVVHVLYELLLCHVLRVAVLPDNSPQPTFLPASAIVPVGFGAHEEVLPHPPHAHPGYRLLQEYFAFPIPVPITKSSKRVE